MAVNSLRHSFIHCATVSLFLVEYRIENAGIIHCFVCYLSIVSPLILQDMMSASLVFRLIREHPIGLVLDLGQDKCVKNHTLFALLIKKPVSIQTICCQNYSANLQTAICYRYYLCFNCHFLGEQWIWVDWLPWSAREHFGTFGIHSSCHAPSVKAVMKIPISKFVICYSALEIRKLIYVFETVVKF